MTCTRTYTRVGVCVWEREWIDYLWGRPVHDLHVSVLSVVCLGYDVSEDKVFRCLTSADINQVPPTLPIFSWLTSPVPSSKIPRRHPYRRARSPPHSYPDSGPRPCLLPMGGTCYYFRHRTCDSYNNQRLVRMRGDRGTCCKTYISGGLPHYKWAPSWPFPHASGEQVL